MNPAIEKVIDTECIKEKCAWWVERIIRDYHQKENIDEGGCAIKLLVEKQ